MTENVENVNTGANAEKSCHVECNKGLKSENKSIIKKKMQHFAQNVAFFNYTIYFGAISENLTPKYNFFILKNPFLKKQDLFRPAGCQGSAS